MYDAALRWLREDVDIPDSRLYITLSDFEVINFTLHISVIIFCLYVARHR